MIEAIDTGGPAFPHAGNKNFSSPPQKGMTLRDYFAVQATERDISEHRLDDDGVIVCSREVARFRFADAMIAAR